jgi:hypothetical protein
VSSAIFVSKWPSTCDLLIFSTARMKQLLWALGDWRCGRNERVARGGVLSALWTTSRLYFYTARRQRMADLQGSLDGRTESSCVTVLHQSSSKLSNCSARKSISVLTDGNNPRREAKTA